MKIAVLSGTNGTPETSFGGMRILIGYVRPLRLSQFKLPLLGWISKMAIFDFAHNSNVVQKRRDARWEKLTSAKKASLICRSVGYRPERIEDIMPKGMMLHLK